jgi:hypothetical protein
VGTYSSPGTTYTAPAENPAIYWANAQALVPMDASTNPGATDYTTPSLPALFTSSKCISVSPGGAASQNFILRSRQHGLMVGIALFAYALRP